MADNAVAAQVQVPQTTQNLLQNALALQKLKQAFPASSSLAQPVQPTAFNAGGSDD